MYLPSKIVFYPNWYCQHPVFIRNWFRIFYLASTNQCLFPPFSSRLYLVFIWHEVNSGYVPLRFLSFRTLLGGSYLRRTDLLYFFWLLLLFSSFSFFPWNIFFLSKDIIMILSTLYQLEIRKPQVTLRRKTIYDNRVIPLNLKNTVSISPPKLK